MAHKNSWKRGDCLVSNSEPEFELGAKLTNDSNPNGYSVPVKMTIRTNVPVNHWCGMLIHELSGMKHKGRVHVDFVHNSTESLGFLDKFDISDKEIKASGQLVSIEPGDIADVKIKQLQAGIPMESSIYFAGQGLVAEEFGEGTKFKANGKSMVGPAIVFREWPLRGVALCPYGADNNTSTSLALSEETVNVNFINKESEMSDENKNVGADALVALEKKNVELAAKLAEVEAAKAKKPTGKDYMDAFGEKGAVYFAEGKTWEEAQILSTAALKKENEELTAKLAAVHRGGEDKDAPGGGDGEVDNAKLTADKLKDKIQKTSLKVGRRLSFFACGMRSASERKSPEWVDHEISSKMDMNKALKNLYMEIVNDTAERHRDMKFASPTLIDIAIQNAADGAVGLIDETIEAHPELDVMPARTIMGINYKTLVRITLPTVAFRDANEGTAATKSTYVNRLVETFILNPNWDCDKAVADRHEDGPQAFIAVEAGAIMEAAMQHLASIFYYGTIDTNRHATAGDAKAFNGLHSQIGVSVAANILVDAGGTSATTGSSVFMVKGGPQGVQWVWGNNGSLNVSPVREERVTDSGGTNKYTAYFQELLAYPGLQVASTQCVGRIGELTEEATCQLTDAYLAKLWSLFPVNSKPDHIFMNRRSQRQLRDSRIYATGGTVVERGKPVPFSYEWEGVPIHVTDAIENTEVIAKITA